MRVSRWLKLLADHSGDIVLAIYATVAVAGVLLVAVIALESI